MTEEVKAVVEKMAVERFNHLGAYSLFDFVHDTTALQVRRDIFLSGANALDELYSKDEYKKSVIELAGEVQRLKEVVDIKESERVEWSGMCIKKQKEIERLKDLIWQIYERNVIELSEPFHTKVQEIVEEIDMK